MVAEEQFEGVFFPVVEEECVTRFGVKAERLFAQCGELLFAPLHADWLMEKTKP